MTITYNVDIVGTLTNNNGVLSGFSTTSYAKLPEAFSIGSNPWEVQLKVTTGSNITSDQCILTPFNVNKDCLNVWVNSSRIIPVFVDSNETDITEFQINCTANTTYWIRMKYENQQYSVEYSTNGTSYTSAGTPYSSSTPVWDTGDVWCLGIARGVNRPFNGSIDLNECYVKINGSTVWTGVTSPATSTRIQMRRGTASRWTTVNPVLLSGELGVETDTNKFKIGDGATAWSSLNYQGGGTVDQTFDGTSANAQSGVSILGVLEAIYPVGSVYLSTNSTCPLASLFGTWTLVASGKALWTGDGTNGDTTIAASLPNIAGTLGPSRTLHTYSGSYINYTAPFTKNSISGTTVIGSNSNNTDVYKYGIDFSKSNTIYNANTTTVQPPAYVVNVWKRTA